MSLKTWRPYFIILVVGFLLFYQTLFFNISYLDDQALLIDNAPIMQAQGIPGIFSHDVFFSKRNIYYRPLLNLSFFVEMKINNFNSDYFIFHFFNILIHILAVFCLFAILKQFKYKDPLALFLSLVFLVHPVLTQAVAWIPGRNDSLLALFILASFYCLLIFLKNKKLWSFLGHIFFFLLALFTKETAVFAGLVFFIYLIIVKREKVFSLDSRLLYLAWSSVLIIYFLARNFALGVNRIDITTIISSLKDNLAAFIIASGKIFFPFNLKVLPINADSSLVFGILTFIIASLLFIFFAKKNWRQAVFGLTWFLIFLLPTLFLQSKRFGVNFNLEHRIYLPLVGVLILVAELTNLRQLNWKKIEIKIGAIIIIIFLATLTFFHSLDFKNGLIFWQSAVRTSPDSSLAQRNLGVMYYFNNQLKLAEKQYQKSLLLDSQEPMAHNNLGLIYLREGKLKIAQKEFKLELSINPGYDKALFNLGNLYYQENNYSAAKKMWQETLKVNPYNIEAHNRLINLENKLR